MLGFLRVLSNLNDPMILAEMLRKKKSNLSKPPRSYEGGNTAVGCNGKQLLCF